MKFLVKNLLEELVFIRVGGSESAVLLKYLLLLKIILFYPFFSFLSIFHVVWPKIHAPSFYFTNPQYSSLLKQTATQIENILLNDPLP